MSRSFVRGFSLLEMLVAVAVLAMSLAMLYKAVGGVLQATSAVQMQQTAVQVAQSVLNSREYLSSSGWHENGSDAGIDWSVSSVLVPEVANSRPANPVRLHQVSLNLVWQGRSGRVYWSIHTLLPETVATSGPPSSSP